MNYSLFFLTSAVAIFLFHSSCASPEPLQSKPNILFFLVDDLGWADVGYNGATYHLTPNIDAFARKALVFDNAYTMPTCSPSRVSLFTGMSAPRTGIYHVEAFDRTPEEIFKVKPVKSGHFYEKSLTMLGSAMKSAGYATGYVGKWHVDNDPLGRGFDFNAGGWGSGGPASYFSPYKNPALKDGPKGEYLPERLLKEATGFIKANKNHPFFLCYAPYLVHRPLQAREEDIVRFEKREKEAARYNPTYAAMVEMADRVFRSVLDVLEDEGLADNTVIVFTSDNGINGLIGDATPLRGEKGSCYEGGVRVPAMVYWPGVTRAVHTRALIDVVDWYPTLLQVARAKLPEHTLDGKSLLPILSGAKESVRETVCWHMPCYNGKPWSNQVWQPPFSAIRLEKYKLIYFYEDGHTELYDLEKDISEKNNLVKLLPAKVNELHNSLKIWLNKVNAPIPTDLNSKK